MKTIVEAIAESKGKIIIWFDGGVSISKYTEVIPKDNQVLDYTYTRPNAWESMLRYL